MATYYSDIEHLQYSTETIAALTAVLATARKVSSSASNLIKGYYFGGSTPSAIDGLNFSNETAFVTLNTFANSLLGASVCSVLSQGKIANSCNFTMLSDENYYHGLAFALDGISVVGDTDDPSFYHLMEIDSIANKLTNSDESSYTNVPKIDAIANKLLISDESVYNRTALSITDSTKAYISDSTTVGTIYGWRVYDEVGRTLNMTLPTPYRQVMSSVSSASRGYYCAGYLNATTYYADIDAVQFNDETMVNTASVLSLARYWTYGSHNTLKGYVIGGYTSTVQSKIDAITFATEACAAIAALLITPRYAGCISPIGDNIKGYSFGGVTTVYVNKVEALVYATETSAAVTATLSKIKDLMSGAVTSTKGYVMGGWNGTTSYTDIERITYATEAIALLSATLSVARNTTVGVTGLSNGFAIGGSANTEIDGVTYATETAYNPYNILGAVSNLAGSVDSRKQAGQVVNSLNFTLVSDESIYNKLQVDGFSNIVTIGDESLYNKLQVDGFSNKLAIGDESFYHGLALAIHFKVGLSDETYYHLMEIDSIANKVMISDESYYSRTVNLADSTKCYINDSTAGALTGWRVADEVGLTYAITLPTPYRQQLTGVGSHSRGYYCGGLVTTTYYADIDSITFLSDTVLNTSAVLTLARAYPSAYSNNVKGYIVAGTSAAGVFNTKIDALIFASEACYAITATIGTGRYVGSTLWNYTNGYYCGGLTSVYLGIIDKFSFATEVNAVLSATLSRIKDLAWGASSTTAGYTMGGWNGTVVYSDIEKLNFGNDTNAITATTLSVARLVNTGCSGLYNGFVIGGRNATTTFYNEIDGVNFTNDTAYNPYNILSATVSYTAAAVDSRKAAGQVVNSLNFTVANEPIGYTPVLVAIDGKNCYGDETYYRYVEIDSIANKVGLSDETYYHLTEVDSVANKFIISDESKYYTPQFDSSDNTKAWLSDNNIGVLSAYRTFDEVALLLSITLPLPGRMNQTGIYGFARGYFCGGFVSPTYYNSIDAITFRTETVDDTAATLSALKYQMTGISGNNKGYLCGGYNGTAYQTAIEALTFVDETRATLAGVLSAVRSYAGGINSDAAGYTCGGYNGTAYVSVINKILFSTDTVSTLSATLTRIKSQTVGTNNTVKGFISGGYIGTSHYADIDRLTFATEVCAAASTTLTQARRVSAGVSNLTNGYNCSGFHTTQVTNTEATNFSTETTVAKAALLTFDLATASVDNHKISGKIYAFVNANVIGDEVYYAQTHIDVIANKLLINDESYIGIVMPIAGYTVIGDFDDNVYYGSLEVDSIANKLNLSDESNYSNEPKIDVIANKLLISDESKYNGNGTINDTTKVYINNTYTGNLVGYRTWDEVATLLNIVLPTPYRQYSTAINSHSRGYFCGGSNSGSTIYYSDIDSINFIGENVVNTAATLSTLRHYGIGLSSTIKGYMLGGYNTTVQNTIDALTFTMETCSTISATLTIAKNIPCSVGDYYKGYDIGGHNGTAYISNIDKFVYTNETCTANTDSLSKIKGWQAGSNNDIAGYACGGNNGTVNYNEIEKIAFDTDVVSLLSAVILSARQCSIGVSGIYKGYNIGGSTATEIDAIIFATETAYDAYNVLSITQLGTGVDSHKASMRTITNIVGSIVRNDESNYISVDAIVFKTTISDESIYNKLQIDGFSNKVTISDEDYYTTPIDVNDTTKAYLNYNLTGSLVGYRTHDETALLLLQTLPTPYRQYETGISAYSYGYYCGGSNSGSTIYYSDIDSLNFGSETINNNSVELTLARHNSTGLTSSQKGYVCGGAVGATKYNKIDGLSFNTEVVAAITATLSVIRNVASGVGDITKGYVCGGSNAAVYVSTVDQLNYANETCAANSSSLSKIKGWTAGTNSSTTGYICAGYQA